jgi:nitrate/nitrite transporter NarK
MLPLKPIYFAHYAAFGAHAPYINLYLDRIGLSHQEIGILSGLLSAITVAAPRVRGPLSDRLSSRRPLLVISMVGAIVVYSGMWGASSF